MRMVERLCSPIYYLPRSNSTATKRGIAKAASLFLERQKHPAKLHKQIENMGSLEVTLSFLSSEILRCCHVRGKHGSTMLALLGWYICAFVQKHRQGGTFASALYNKSANAGAGCCLEHDVKLATHYPTAV